MIRKLFSVSRLRSVMLVSFLLLAVAAFAVPARPGLTRQITLSDGTTISATLVGDEYGHCWLGADGKSYQAVPGTDVFQEVNRQTLAQRAQQRRTQANQHRTRRMAQRRIGTVGNIEGQKKGLIILVNFSDVEFQSTHNNALYNDIANKKGFSMKVNDTYSFQGSMYDYFYDQSEGKFELTFDVAGPYTLSQPQTYYGENDSKGNDMHPAEMVIEALNLADPYVNFADYDWDGNGTVEQVYVVYAGKGEADGGAAYTIWPHEWTLSSANYYHDGEGPQTLDGVTVDTYACGGELNGWYDDGTIAGIGTMCHEFSHCLGYPDFYDTDYSGGQGMGYWDLMDGGSYNGAGYCPAGYTSYERWMAGWKTPIELNADATISNMAALQTYGSNTYIIYNSGNRNEYFLLENRQNTKWDSGLYGEGLLILHVDYDESVWKRNKPNDDPSHQRLTWIPADNEYQKNNGRLTYPGMKNDPFPYGSVNSFSRKSTPRATFYNANANGKYYLESSVDNITQNTNGTISFTFDANGPDVVPFIMADKSMMFSAILGSPQTLTLNVFSEGLTGDLTLTLNDEHKVFSLASNTISTNNDATVDVTFSPTVAGNYSATLTLANSGAEPVTVQLTGAAINENLILANDGTTNAASIATAAGSGRTYDVTLAGRTLYKDGEWNTICLPFNLVLDGSPLDGATALTLTDASMTGTTVSLTFGNPDSSTEPITVLKAGKPYIIKWEGDGTNNIVNPVFENVSVVSSLPADRTISIAGDHVNFIGYYDAFNITAADEDIYYMTTGNALKHTGTDRTLKACRAYFQFSETVQTTAREFVMSFGDGEETGINSLTPDPSRSGEGSIYTLNGVKLDKMPTRKGMYIHNGRVLVIK